MNRYIVPTTGPAGKGDEPVEDIGVRPGLDRIREASACADLRTDDLAGHAEDVLGDLVGDDDPLAGGLGEVPRVDQELDREDAQGRTSGHLVRADLDLTVQAAGIPGLERGLGRRGEPGLQGGPAGLGGFAGLAASAPAAVPKKVTDPIRCSASWVTSNSVHAVASW